MNPRTSSLLVLLLAATSVLHAQFDFGKLTDKL